MSNTWSNRGVNMMMTFKVGENEIEIDFMLIKKEHRRFIRNVKTIPVIADVDKKKIRQSL